MTVEPREHSYRREEKKCQRLALTRERKPSRVHPQLFLYHIPLPENFSIHIENGRLKRLKPLETICKSYHIYSFIIIKTSFS